MQNGFPKDSKEQHEFARVALDAGAIKCPGLMLYQDVLDVAGLLSDAQCGRFFKAISEYRRNCTSPDFKDDPSLLILFRLAKTRADVDEENYAIKVMQRAYAASGERVKNANGKETRKRDPFPAWFTARYLGDIDSCDYDQDPDGYDYQDPDFDYEDNLSWAENEFQD